MPVLAGGQGLEGQLGLEVGRPLVEERVVAGRPDVLDHAPGQPEQVVRGVRPADEPGPAVLEPVEPVDHVPFEELLRGVQEDLPAGDRRVHPEQVDRVLQLVAEPERPARLVEPPAGPDPLGQGLVLEPVEVAVELRVGRSRPRTVSIRPSHQRRVASRLGRAAVGVADTCG